MKISRAVANRSCIEGVAAILVAVIACSVWGWLIVISDKIIPGADLPVHFRWASQFILSLSEGEFRPRWASLAHLGAGDPSFIYYQPGFFYSVALFNWVGFDIWPAMKACLVVSNFLLGLTIYTTFRRRVGYAAAIVGGTLAQLQPFTFFLVYYFHAFPWAFATPLAVIMVWRSLSSNENRIDLVLALALAALIISHILSAFICLVVIGSGVLIQATLTRHFGRILYWAFSVLLGLGISAFYLIPAVLTQHWISPENWFVEGVLDWRNSFAFPIISAKKWGISWMNPQWYQPSLIMISLAGALVLLSKNRKIRQEHIAESTYVPIIFLIPITIFFASELSLLLWSHIETLRIVQRPFRFIGVLSVISMLLSPFAFSIGFNQGARLRLAGLSLLLLPLFLFFAMQYQVSIQGVSAAQNLQAAMQGDFGQREYFPANTGEQWKEYFSDGGLANECRVKNLACSDVQENSHIRIWLVEGEEKASLRLPVFDFPSWAVRLDGKNIKKSVDQNTGLVEIDIPDGKHEIELYWNKTSYEVFGEYISFFSVAALVLTIVYRLLSSTGFNGARASVKHN